MTDAEYILSLIDETFAEVPQIKAHHERMRKIAARLEEMANGLTEVETDATPSCTGLTVKPWTKWKGGECPVPEHSMVEVEFDGRRHISPARNFEWKWYDDGYESSGDITSYRVL